MSMSEEALSAHERWRGKIEISVRAPLDGVEALSLAYTPGVGGGGRGQGRALSVALPATARMRANARRAITKVVIE